MARTEANATETDAIRELLHYSSLTEVEFHEVSARKLEENQQRSPDENSVDVSMQVRHHVGDDGFGVMLMATLHPYHGEIQVSVAAEYSVEGGHPIDEHTVRAFGNEVSVMTLLPFAREAVSSLAARVWQKPLLLPTLERGEVGFDLDESADQ